jgi:hypothetical protein
MAQIRLAEDRGHVHNHWLDTYHTFSFDSYHDSRFMGYRSLRVMNDDTVQPGQGFGTHPHNDMEIVTYVLRGTLEHRDSMGNGSVIKAGDVQHMSAGTGVLHSEFNPSEKSTVHFLQIWILPREKGVRPSYQQTGFTREEKLGCWCLIASPDGIDGSLKINQDAKIMATVLEPSQEIVWRPDPERYLWLQVARGKVRMGEDVLKAGDGAAIHNTDEIAIESLDDTEALMFDLA